MKNKIKITLSLLFILCITALLALTGCGDKAITDAYITNSNLPRTNYVEGQELDLSKGYLTLIRGGEEANIPFTAEGVTVSGYEKNTVGEQTLTVTYGEVSTTFKVTVAPRIVAENFEKNYFVGATFNATKGRLKVASDDGKVTNVNFNDKKVSVVSFDTETAGKKTVTVRYTNGSTSYDYQYEITVYEAANIVYNPPKNTDYYSHKTQIDDKDVRDGSFTITSADGKLTEVVPIRADMVKGFTPSLATIDNRTEALEQTLKIEYLGNSYDYKINIYFSGVSVIQYYADGELEGLDLSGKLNAAQKAASYDAIKELLKLTPAEMMALSDKTVNKVVAAASVGVMDLFMSKLNTYNHAFAMNDEGILGLTGVNYTACEIALNDLLDESSDINTYVRVLRQLEADYGTVAVTATEKVADVILVYSEEMENLLLPILKHIVTVYELIRNVPDDWTREDLKTNSTNIIDAILEIKRSEIYKNGLGNIYTDVLSKWRTKDDLIDIIYTFALYVYDGGSETFMQDNLFGQFPMPDMLEDVYQQVVNTYGMQNNLYQNQLGDLWLADLSTYAASYFLTLDFANAVKTSGNQFLIDIYNEYNMDYIIASYTGAQNFGFNYHAGAMVDSEKFMTLWGQYYAVLQLYLTNNLDATKHEALITGMFDTFQSMTPNEVFGFLSSLNLCYGDARGSSPVLYLDFEEKLEANLFAKILREYYSTYLGENIVPIFADLLMAIESACLFGENETTLANFVAYMEAVNAAYGKLNKTESANFDKYLGKSYAKHLDMYKRIIGEELDKKPTEDELALIAQLRSDIKKYENIYNYVANLKDDQLTEAHYILLYSAFAKVVTTYKDLTDDCSEAALTVLFTEGYTFLEREGTLGKAYYQIDKVTTRMMQNSAAVEKNGKTILVSHWDMLASYGLLDIYSEMLDLLCFALVDGSPLPEASQIDALAAKIAALDEFTTIQFLRFGGAPAYYSAKCYYIDKTTSSDATVRAVAQDLSTAAALYNAYRNDPYTTTNTTAFVEAMLRIQTVYNDLSEAQKATLKEVFDFYLEIAKSLPAGV